MSRNPQALNLVLQYKRMPPWLLLVIYASNFPSLRKALWNEFLSISILSEILWFLCRDLNFTASLEDKLGGCQFTLSHSVLDLKYFLFWTCLLDLGFVGNRFTWCNSHFGRDKIDAHLDYALANESWISLFIECSISHLPKVLSDHSPILFKAGHQVVTFRPRPIFRFENFWLEWWNQWSCSQLFSRSLSP